MEFRGHLLAALVRSVSLALEAISYKHDDLHMVEGSGREARRILKTSAGSVPENCKSCRKRTPPNAASLEGTGY